MNGKNSEFRKQKKKILATQDLNIKHSNQLVEACYSLSLPQMRVLMLACSRYDSRKANVGVIQISVQEYQKMFGKGANDYATLAKAAKDLIRNPINIFNEKLDGMKSMLG